MKENKGLIDYIFVSVVFAVIVAFLYFLFTIGLSVENVKVVNDTTIQRQVNIHENRLDHIDSLHIKYINEK